MTEQLALFAVPGVGVLPRLGPADIPAKPDAAWPQRTWRWTSGPGRGIEYRYPDPLGPPPAPLRLGTWTWNQLIPDWQLGFSAPPLALAPRATTSDAHGPKLLPPRGFALIDMRRLEGRCPHCKTLGGNWLFGQWCGWHDPRVALAYSESLARHHPCYGYTTLDVPGLGPIEPLHHFSRWAAAHCSRCGALHWHDFRGDHPGHYYHPPVLA